MKREIMTTLAIDGEDKFKREMADAARQLRVLNSETKANTAAFADNAKSMEALTSHGKNLKKQIEQQKEIMKALAKAVEESANKYGEADKRTDGYRIKLNNAAAALSKLEAELAGVNKEIDNQSSKWNKAAKSLEEASQKMIETGDKISGIGEKMSAGITAPIMAAGGVILKGAIDAENAQGKLQASLGLTKEAAADLEAVAESVWINGFGDNIDEVNAALTSVRKNMGNLAEDEMQKVTEGAMTIAAVFDQDVSEVTAAAGVAMKNFKVDSQKALDVITYGFQKGGDYSGELLDTIREYSPQFVSLGLSIEQSMGILIAGAQAGAWNLDKVGDSLKEFNIRAQDGSKTTADGFAAIGLNSQKMGEKIAAGGDQAKEAFIATVTALAGMNDPLKQNLAGTALFGTQWEDVRSKVITALVDGAKGLEGFKGSTEAASKAVTENNPGAALTSSFRELESAVGPALLPLADIIKNDIAPAIKSLAEGFASLSPEGKKAAITIAAIAAAAGPTTWALGGMLKGISTITGGAGSLIKLLGPAASATVAVGETSTVAVGAAGAGGVAGLGASLGAAAVAAGPWLLAGAAVVGTGYVIKDVMSKEAIPAVDLFTNELVTSSGKIVGANQSISDSENLTVVEISEGTKKAVGAYMELDTQASQSLSNLYVNSTTITEQTTADMVGKYTAMATQIKAGMDNHHQQQLTDMQTFFANSGALSDAEEAQALAKLKNDNETKKSEMDAYTKRIQEILNLTSQKNRALTLEEQKEINGIQDKMKVNAVNALSEQEIESKVILERLKEYGSRVTAEQASEIIKNANKQRDDSVNATNQQYDQTLHNIIKMRDESKVITADQAEKMIAGAKLQRDESIKKAEELRAGVVGKLEETHRGILDQVSDKDGSIKSAWTNLLDWFAQRPIVQTIKRAFEDANIGAPGTLATGTSSWRGGLTYMNERGYELYDLPRGTKVYNHDASEDLVLKTAQEVAKSVLSSSPSSGGLSVTIENFINNRAQDVQAFAEELEFYKRQACVARGVS